MDFHSKTVKETAKILGTSLTKGLEPTEVVNRLNEYGKKNSNYNTVFKSV